MTALRSGTGCGSAHWNRIPMSDAKTLSDRIDALEARLMFQEQTIEMLNKAITEQWLKIDALTRQGASLNDRLQEPETNAPGSIDEPPPHYCTSRPRHRKSAL